MTYLKGSRESYSRHKSVGTYFEFISNQSLAGTFLVLCGTTMSAVPD